MKTLLRQWPGLRRNWRYVLIPGSIHRVISDSYLVTKDFLREDDIISDVDQVVPDLCVDAFDESYTEVLNTFESLLGVSSHFSLSLAELFLTLVGITGVSTLCEHR